MRGLVMLVWLAGSAFAAGDGLQVRDGRVAVGDAIVSPAAGLWQIACEWRDGWPAGWQYARPRTAGREGEWTVLRAEVEACGGPWTLEDAYRQTALGVEGRRRWHWRGQAAAERVTLSVRFHMAARGPQTLLPGILYFGNPSGAKSGRVPVFTGRAGEEAIFEEHRYPMPFAYVEGERGDGRIGAALHTTPAPAPYGNLTDQWWSLGVAAVEDGVDLVALSGPCAANGRRSAVKATQHGFLPYDNAWLNLPPGAIVEKRFLLEAGAGFERPVRTAVKLWRPDAAEGLPAFGDAVRAKYRYALSRWHETPREAGFKKYAERTSFVMGWTGQAEAPGYALLVLGDKLGDPQAVVRARKALDFLAGAPFYAGGFHNWYDFAKGAWSGEEPLNQGQAMLAFARAIRVARARKLPAARWEAFLEKACRLHAARLLNAAWRPVSTNEAAFIAPLLETADLFGEAQFRRAAEKAARHYAERHLALREPYWGGTLDARSEDKEGAALALEGFLALYERTRAPEHLAWARHAAAVVLSYVFVWDAALPPGRLADHHFRTVGWTVVSPQNQHLDVWSVLLAPDLWRLGQLTGDADLQRLAQVMARTCGQLIDARGSQGEQMHHTNYPALNEPGKFWFGRGGYNEQWTVFWITAHFLTAAARFVELGVPVFQEAR